jgi:L-threonylcarbamoyladenylate synthase
MKIIKLSQKPLSEAVKIIKGGGVIICPTDTVYGFLADATNKKSVEKIFKIKKRPKSKPLAVFVKDLKMAKEFADIKNDQEKELKKRWPGKYTFILNVKSEARNVKFLNSKLLTKNKTIALRVPKNKLIISIIKKLGRPLAQTSVNISGKQELNKISDIVSAFEKLKIKPDLLLDGGSLPKRSPSTIIDLTKNKVKILR